jgi:hypothetical protein
MRFDFRYEITEIANAKLNALIESWPMVYWSGSEQLIYREKIKNYTHKARLAFIEEIVKEPCRHEPENLQFMTTINGMVSISDVQTKLYGTKKYCKHCGAELQATWSEKKI